MLMFQKLNAIIERLGKIEDKIDELAKAEPNVNISNNSVSPKVPPHVEASVTKPEPSKSKKLSNNTGSKRVQRNTRTKS